MGRFELNGSMIILTGSMDITCVAKILTKLIENVRVVGVKDLEPLVFALGHVNGSNLLVEMG